MAYAKWVNMDTLVSAVDTDSRIAIGFHPDGINVVHYLPRDVAAALAAAIVEALNYKEDEK